MSKKVFAIYGTEFQATVMAETSEEAINILFNMKVSDLDSADIFDIEEIEEV